LHLLVTRSIHQKCNEVKALKITYNFTSLQVKAHGNFLLRYKYKVLLFYFLLVLLLSYFFRRQHWYCSIGMPQKHQVSERRKM